jgi:hypothetical protein
LGNLGYGRGNLRSISTGQENTAIGVSALSSVTTGNFNTGVGQTALTLLSTGADNTAIGCDTLLMTTTASSNTAVGSSSLYQVTTGYNNVGVGYGVGNKGTNAINLTTGHDNVWIGYVTGEITGGSTGRNYSVIVGSQAKTAGDYATSIGYAAGANAAGTVAIGVDSSGNSATTSTANEIKVGTVNHTTTHLGKSKLAAHAITSGSLSTASPVSGTALQVDTTTDRFAMLSVTLTPTSGASATCVVAISADNVTYSTLVTETVPAGTALDSFVRGIGLQVPAGWYVKFTVTNGTLGTLTYY